MIHEVVKESPRESISKDVSGRGIGSGRGIAKRYKDLAQDLLMAAMSLPIQKVAHKSSESNQTWVLKKTLSRQVVMDVHWFRNLGNLKIL